MSEPVQATEINQTDYLKLFMQELTYQDPLKPVDNREFMAQMAQFSSLQEAHTSNAHLTQLLGLTSGNQSLTLLGKKVTLANGAGEGTVSKIRFEDKQPPKITVNTSTGTIPNVDLKQIIAVEE